MVNKIVEGIGVEDLLRIIESERNVVRKKECFHKKATSDGSAHDARGQRVCLHQLRVQHLVPQIHNEREELQDLRTCH
jgi:hypothetical protein